jgi:vacuolar-type H+-ATPase subunit D/Vma8
MAKAKKITKKELESIQELQNKLNNIIQNIGLLESQKHGLLHEIVGCNKEIEEFKAKLESKYGSVNISLEDGTYTNIEKNVEGDKKD